MTESERPHYDSFLNMSKIRGPLAEGLARQAIETTRPWLSKPVAELDVLDVGSGYGHTALALARSCRRVIGVEPSSALVASARDLAIESEQPNLEFRQGVAEELPFDGAFDLIVLDNVYEHIPDQRTALERICRALRPGGAAYILVPNRLWPIEAHYHLPFLSWLPLPLANAYLRRSGRGSDYEDASYAPTYWSLRRELRANPELSFEFVLPGDPSATVAGSPLHYRVGMSLLRRVPALWAISKALLVVAVKDGSSVQPE